MEKYIAMNRSGDYLRPAGPKPHAWILIRMISGEYLVVERDFALVHSPDIGYFFRHRKCGLVSRAFPTDKELREVEHSGNLDYLGYCTD